MDEILSQHEIESLLSAMSSGEVKIEVKQEVDGRNIKNYDFRRPNKFSKDQLNTIELIYDDFCRSFSTLLSGLLRTKVDAKLGSVTQCTYEDFLQKIPNPTILNVFSLAPLEGKGLMEMNPVIAFSIIDRLFGGPGLSTFDGRPITEIEKNVIQRISEKVLLLFKDAWKICYDINPYLEVIEINPQLAQVVSPLEMVIIITISIKIGETEDFMNVCLPCLMLEPIADKLNTRFWFAGTSASSAKDYSQYLQRVVETTDIPLTVVLGNNTIKIRDLLELQAGDVIPLDKPKDADAELYLGSKLKFYGQVGQMGNKLAFKINKACNEGSD
ncbi:MAG: flagellar motor switch protein FliM [Clostridia bacterium]|nr:flagellar motor switch protein FliM [Clostridia bacterium]